VFSFTVDAYSDLKFEGTVSQVRLQPVTTNNVVTYVVILNAPNPDKKLMPGMTASATIYVEEKKNTLLLSGKAVRFTPDQAYMMKMFQKMRASGSMPKNAGRRYGRNRWNASEHSCWAIFSGYAFSSGKWLL